MLGNTLRKLKWIAILTGASLMHGCVRTTPYPADWPGIADVQLGRCALIEGRYAVHGMSAGECRSVGVRHQLAYDWNCNTELTANILSGRPADASRAFGTSWVEIQQPDENTLVLTVEEGAPIILKQDDGDFTCDSNGVTISQSGSGFKRQEASTGQTAYTTTGLVFFGSVQVATLTRRFRRAEDGSLLMTIRSSSWGTLFFIPAGVQDTRYVRWRQVGGDTERKPTSPK